IKRRSGEDESQRGAESHCGEGKLRQVRLVGDVGLILGRCFAGGSFRDGSHNASSRVNERKNPAIIVELPSKWIYDRAPIGPTSLTRERRIKTSLARQACVDNRARSLSV